MRLRPLNDTLVVRLDEDEWKHIKDPDVIVIPSAYEGGYKKKATSGKIVSWGSECRFNHKIGDRVYFSWADNRPGITEDSNDYRFVKEDELLAKDEDA